MAMKHATSDCDMTSLAPSSPHSTPKLPAVSSAPLYYVQSPSSHDDKSYACSNHPTPSESPSHSRASSTRLSGTYSGTGAWRKWGRRSYYYDDQADQRGRFRAIEEGVDEGGVIGGGGGCGGERRRCQFWIWLVGLVSSFSFFCFILWCASRPYKPLIVVKSLTVHNLYVWQGSDLTGVPTKMITTNCSLKMSVYNPAPFFGIHVSSMPVDLMYSEILAATGELESYYQPRKSHRTVYVNLEGKKVPLYGAGAMLSISDDIAVTMTLAFEVESRGDVVGKLVRSNYKRRISCSVVAGSHINEIINLQESSCTYG